MKLSSDYPSLTISWWTGFQVVVLEIFQDFFQLVVFIQYWIWSYWQAYEPAGISWYIWMTILNSLVYANKWESLVTLRKSLTIWTSLVASLVKRLPKVWETRVWSLGQEGPLENEMAMHSSTLAWKIPWMEEPGGLQSMGSLRVQHDWATSLSLFTFMYWRRKWQPTPVFLPGKSQGRGSLVGCRLWGHTKSDTTEVT